MSQTAKKPMIRLIPLLVRGVAVTADGQTRRTCYGYDALGRRISETKPNAGLGACP